MSWEDPSFEHISMSAEIGSYQNDFDDTEHPNYALPHPDPRLEHTAVPLPEPQEE